MKIKKINPFDFRYFFTPTLLIVTVAGTLTHKLINPKFATIYIFMTITFLICLHLGAAGIHKVTKKQLNDHTSKLHQVTLIRSRFLFLLTQIYFIYLFAIILMFFAAGGISAFETLRTDLKGSINSYFYIPFQYFCIISICHEIFHHNQLNSNNRIAASTSTASRSKEKSFALAMVLIYFIETAALGSRSVIFVAATTFLLSWLRGSSLAISRTAIFLITGIAVSIFSFISFARLFSNPETFNWWVSQGYFNSFDFNDIGPVTATTTMLTVTFGDMAYRPITVIQHILQGNLEHTYGATSFFFWYSMLPGSQVDPGIFLNHNVFFSGTDAGIPATIVSQLFWDFGWLGISAGGVLIGLLGRLLCNLSANRKSPIYTALYAMFFVQLMLGIYGTFNIGLLLFYITLSIPLGIFMSGRIR